MRKLLLSVQRTWRPHSRVRIGSHAGCQISMAKREGATTVVVGGKEDVPQQYCGVVGGQSIRFPTIDTEIKVSQRALVSFFNTDDDVSVFCRVST